MTRMQIYDLLMRINDGYVPSAEERRELQEVQRLDLRLTQITELPESVGELKNLQRLDLSGTRITELPESVGGLKNLQELYLSSTKITELPESVGELKNLQRLDLSYTNIPKLPESVGELKNLQRLYLSSTNITELPESVGELKNLQRLDLDITRITELPEWLGNLPRLEHLNLSCLTLERIPRSLAMSGMKFVDSYDEWRKTGGVNVHNLTLTEQNLSVFINTPELIPSLYESGDDLITVHESKVIFFGDGEAGKSYTIQRFLNGGKKETEDNQYKTSETPGIEIVDYRVERGEDSFNIHFWDFGGQLILHSMHRCFLTDKTCYVVMVKTRETKSTQRARYWLRNVTSFAPNSPILLYVNCWDNDDGKRAIDECGILRDYPNVKDVVYCSSKQAEDGDFREFMDKLTDMASASVEAREKVPRRWNNLRTALTSENTDYLTKERYYELCADNEIKDADAAPLLTFFNILGVCFSYHRDREKRELADYKLLNPVWLTNAIYAIIEEGMAGAMEGRIRRGIVEQMLRNAAPEDVRGKKYRRTMPNIIYEPNECGYVTDVAAAHDLCYKIDDDTLFFPALCTNNTPVKELDDVADYPQHLEYQLKYTYLPDSVVHQLMIRCLRRELVLKNCWLRGMVLGGMEMHKAFVRMDDDDETLKIDIYSKAGHPAYELFKILRDEITEINNKLGFRKINEYIVKGEDQFSVKTLLNASKGTDVVYGDNGEYTASELLGKFYDEWTVRNMNVIEGMIYIPIRKIDYHKRSKNYEPLRQALWVVYKHRCQVCHKPIDSLDDMQVDHIFPTNWDRNDESAAKYAEVLRQQGMDTDKPDYVENYLPTHGRCNLVKNNHVDILLTMERHRIALNNTDKVLAEMEKRK